ncbi:MAG: hypothetical protein DHS20C18_42860 [Saprospiraceae bacterium]|nr:MAG: hypothetical protein DHS20C18_42860 [Saprospiraceae bacterium]
MLSWSVRGQFCECPTNFLDISTGFDHNVNQFYAAGVSDAYWQVVTDPTGGITPRPANVVQNLGWDPVNGPLTGWVSPFPNGNNGFFQGATYGFETSFCVCEATNQLFYNLNMLADNGVTIILTDDQGNTIQTLGNVPIPIAPPLTQSFTTVTNANGTINNLAAGTYFIRANLMNAGPTALGLHIDGFISGQGLSQRECCNNTGAIVGVKYQDTNCDGQRDLGEPLLPNWRIELYDNNNNLVQWVLTDANGAYAFTNVNIGTYTVQEVWQPNWTPSTPVGGAQNITVNAPQVHTIDFGNCFENCGMIVMETLEPNCEAPWNYDYTFSVQNNTTFTVTDVVFVNPTTGFSFNPQSWPNNNIPPSGGIGGPFNTTISAPTPITQPTQVCFTAVLLSNGQPCCDFNHCITLLPPEDPCDRVAITANQDGCCFDIEVNNDYCEDYFTAIQTTILTNGITFNNLNGGSTWTTSGSATSVRWTPTTANNTIALGLNQDMHFCLDGTGNPPSAIRQVQFDWLALDQNGNEVVVCSEVRTFECEPGCLVLLDSLIECNDDGTYTFTFTVQNNSNQPVMNVFIAPTSAVTFSPSVFVPTSGVILPGNSDTFTTTVTNGNGLPPGTVIFFRLTLLNTNNNWCCHESNLSFILPDCGDCDCGTIDKFQQDINDGFTIGGANCSNITITPNSLQDCDEVFWSVSDLNSTFFLSGTTIGINTFSLTIPGPGVYRVCMSVVRWDDNGNFCFEGIYCEEVKIFCDECIDLSLINRNVPCPARNPLDYVCGCDNRTYINDCIAMYYNGVTQWTPGPCRFRNPGGKINLHGQISGSNGILLNWSLTGEYPYTEYVIERRVTLENDWQEIGVMEANPDLVTYEFLHEGPSYGFNEYQIIGIDENGVLDYSNTVIFNFEGGDYGYRQAPTGQTEVANQIMDSRVGQSPNLEIQQSSTQGDQQGTILVYPNPTTDGQLNVVLPDGGYFSWTIISSQGKVVNRGTLQQDQINFAPNISGLPAGVYLLKVMHEEQTKMATVRIVLAK